MKIVDVVIEARRQGVDYRDSEKQVVASLVSHQSGVYTKLAQKVNRISQLKEEIKQLEDEVKQSTRDDIADLFDAEDAVKTRVVETMSFILTLSKDPAATRLPKYKDILEALTEHLTPELIIVLEELKSQMVTVVQKSPTLKIQPLGEGVVQRVFARLQQFVANWGRQYDSKLGKLKSWAEVN